jgi:putative alpha-1,2-mannosidase
VRGGTFVIETTGFVEPEADGPVQYVRSAHLNGEPLERTWITTGELHAGGRLHVELGPEPADWGTTPRPPSVTTRPEPPTTVTEEASP